MRLILFWAAGLLLVGAAPPTAVLFRTHLLDATVLAILRRLLADVRSEHHVAVIYDSDVLRRGDVRDFVARALAADGARAAGAADAAGAGGAVELFGVAAEDYVAGFRGRCKGGAAGRAAAGDNGSSCVHPFLGEARANPFKLKHDHPEVKMFEGPLQPLKPTVRGMAAASRTRACQGSAPSATTIHGPTVATTFRRDGPSPGQGHPSPDKGRGQ